MTSSSSESSQKAFVAEEQSVIEGLLCAAEQGNAQAMFVLGLRFDEERASSRTSKLLTCGIAAQLMPVAPKPW
jgi:hypothetical protein